MENLEVFALDARMRRASGSIPYASLQWSRRFRKPGQFSMQVSRDVYDPSWAYIYCDDRPETGIIQKVQTDDDDFNSEASAGVDIVTLSGFFLEGRLNDFVFLVEDVEDFNWKYTPPPTRSFDPAPRDDPKAWASSGGFIYTEGPSGELSGYDPVNHVQKPLASSVANGDGSVTVTDLTGATYTVHPIEYRNTPNYYLYTDTDDDGSHLYSIGFDGTSATTPDTGEWSTWVTDASGSTWRKWNDDPDGPWFRTSGVATREKVASQYEQTEEYKYFTRLKNWRTSTDEGWSKVQIRGPWQRTELGDSSRADDVAVHLTDYVQMFFQDTMHYAEPTFACSKRAINPSLKRLGDLVYAELESDDASCRIVYNFEQDSYLFEIWKGVDRTQSQSLNPWAVFSDEWGTLWDYSASLDTSNYRNTCYVLYDFEEPVDVVSVYEKSVLNARSKIENDYTSPIDPGALKGYAVRYKHSRGYVIARLADGLNDSEVYLDIRNEKPDFDGEWPRGVVDEMPSISDVKAKYASYIATFEDRGIDHLRANYGAVVNFDTGTLSPEDYMERWDLGDRVDMAVNALGLSSEAVIVGIDETYDADKAEIRPIIGDELLTHEQRNALV